MVPAISAAIDPTDKSMPPEMITNVMPTAIMPINDVRVSTFIALSKVAKSGLSHVPPAHNAIRPSNGPTPCRRFARLPSRLRFDTSTPSVCAGRMRDQPLFGELFMAERRDDLAAPHDRHAMAKPDQFDQLRRNHDHCAAFCRERV